METGRPTNWTIEELGAEVALALSVGYEGAPNDRVRDIPDRRTIRYYTTLGLLDRPAQMRGRTALYGRRHLLQLVAIKRLQAQGRPLAELQTELLGRTNRQLEAIAQVPELGELPPPASEAPAPERRRSEFWAAAPSPAEPARREPAADDECLVLHGIRLSDDARLVIDATRPLEEEDIEALRA